MDTICRNLLFSIFLLLVDSAGAAPLKIGVLYPMSGEYAEQGRHSIQGIKLAIESSNQTSDFEFIFEDSGSDSGATLASAVKNLTEQKKVDLVIGPGLVPQALVVAPITEKLGIPLITSALCSPDLLKYKNLVCGYPSTKDQLIDLSKIVSKYKIKKLAFVSDGSQYGTEVGEILKTLEKEGVFELSQTIEIAAVSDAERSVATKVVRSKSDAIFATTQSTATSLNLFKRLNEQGYKGVRIGFLDVDDSMLKGFADNLKGVLLPGYVTSNYSKEFALTYEAKFGGKPDMYAAIGHDMLLTLLASFKKNPDKTKIIESIASTSASQTALKNFQFNVDRTINLPLEVLEIGVETLAPAAL